MTFQFSNTYSTGDIQRIANKDCCIVFIHGFSESKECWSDIVYQVKDHVNVVTYDCLGHGNNSNLWNNASFEAYVDQLKSLIHFLKVEEQINKIILVGHSQGAAIATQYTLQHPDNIDKLMLISPFTYVAEPLKALWTNFLKLVQRGDMELFWNINSSLLLGPKSKSWSNFREKSIQDRLEFFSQEQLILLIKSLLDVKVVGDMSILHNKLTHLIHGEYDTMFPNYYSKEILRYIPEANFIKVDDANHLLIELETHISQELIKTVVEITK
ncbi:alpha/beta fold hydrolase [Bacillus cereus]